MIGRIHRILPEVAERSAAAEDAEKPPQHRKRTLPMPTMEPCTCKKQENQYFINKNGILIVKNERIANKPEEIDQTSNRTQTLLDKHR